MRLFKKNNNRNTYSRTALYDPKTLAPIYDLFIDAEYIRSGTWAALLDGPLSDWDEDRTDDLMIDGEVSNGEHFWSLQIADND